ncbi:rod shape-determining protein MreC [Candidatus Falkowbacteria bacterium]|nr:rod shape-determining protein MreC [Candidatus Falkowbacteria bacterium]
MSKFSIKKIFLFIAVIALLIFLHFTKAILPAESFVINISRPLLSGIYSISSYLRLNYYENSDKRDLIKLAKQLENKVGELTAENAKLKILEEENQVLREYLNFSTKSESSFALADIISREGPSLIKGQSIIIDKGAKDGLKEGLALVSSQGIIVGKIISVKEGLAGACLVNNSECKLAAAIQGQNKTTGLAEGELGLVVKMKFIPQTETIKEGDTVITSGLEKDIPRGLVIGKVARVDKESNELWQTVIIEPLVDFNDLTIVSVLLPK